MSLGPKITAFCPALGNPHLLARMIACWEHQTYENRELIIVEDGGQLDPQSGDRWEIVSVRRRFRSLAEKNNACIALSSFDSHLFIKHDIDDVYLPHALEASVEALSRGEICQPRVAMIEHEGEWVQMKTHGAGGDSSKVDFAFHGNWSFTRAFYEKMRGYQPGCQAGDDQELDRKRRDLGIRSVGIDSSKYQPFYFYHRTPGQISRRGDGEAAYLACAEGLEYVGKLPKYEWPEVWNWPVPEKLLPRRW